MSTLSQNQADTAAELQALMVAAYPTLDCSVGTVIYDLLIKPFSYLVAQQNQVVATVADNMSISQVMSASNPDPVMVDNLLSNYGVYRIAGTQATGQINIFARTSQNVYVSSTLKMTCNGVALQPVKSYVGVYSGIVPEDTAEISYVLMRDYGDGSRVFTITAETVTASTTVIDAGQTVVPATALPNVSRMETGSTFTGGRVEETTTELLARARTTMNSSVVTGRDNIRSLLLQQDAVTVLDSAVFGMGDALQIRDAGNPAGVSTGGRLDLYVKTVPVPVTAVQLLQGYRQQDGSWSVSIPSESLPGAYAVTKLVYAQKTIDAEIQHVLGYTPTGPYPLIESPEHARYSKYQTLSISFSTDAVPVGLTTAVFETYVVLMPGVDVLQDYLNSPGIRSYAFDHVVKAAIPVLVEVDVDLDYPRGTTAPDAGALKQQISDIINLKAMGTEALYTSDIVYACRMIFASGAVRMPINLRARVYLPDGGTAYTSSQHYVKVQDAPGISYRNCFFTCAPGSVNLSLNEVLV